MKPGNMSMLWGLLLIAAGILGMVQAFNIIGSRDAWAVLWSIIFAVAGLAFMWVFLRNRGEDWWAIIPGLTLLALAGLITAALLGLADNGGPWLAGFFFGTIGISFWVIYFLRPEHWWAIIPGGTMFTLAAIAALSEAISGMPLGAMLFFGLALTFGLVFVLGTPHERMTWALIPAAVLAVLGLLVALAFTSIINYVWAVGLILAGVYLLFRQGRGGITRQG